MNRHQRRAQQKQQPPDSDPARSLFNEALALEQQGRLEDAARAYRKLLTRQPSHAEASNNLGRVFQTLGRPREASERYARALMLRPHLFDQYAGILATLTALLPSLAQAIRSGDASALTRDGTDDPLLLCLLTAVPIRDVTLERLMTQARTLLLRMAVADETPGDRVLAFAAALAQQCFINEYVFAASDEDTENASILQGFPALSPLRLMALAMIAPLHTLPQADALLSRKHPAVIDAVIDQQIRQPTEERALRAGIPQLTPIDDAVSRAVQQQYEENPYPRWVRIASDSEARSLDDYLREQFPATPFTPIARDSFDMLIAGCGTGWGTIGLAQMLKGAQITAVDLSLSSLAYAARKTPPALAQRLSYAQADILRLGTLDRRFTAIDAAGVLHHLADPFAGWRLLLDLLEPGGVMHLGFYSERGRADVVAARTFIRDNGYGAGADDIRRCRQALLETPMRSLTRMNDFFTVSECRDLLFHVQETRTDIPALKTFMADAGLTFLGFEFSPETRARYQQAFAERGWKLTDLDRWHAIEAEFPDTFSGMYQFWVQKPLA